MKKTQIEGMKAALDCFGDLATYSATELGELLDFAIAAAAKAEAAPATEVESVPTPAPAKKATKAKAAPVADAE